MYQPFDGQRESFGSPILFPSENDRDATAEPPWQPMA